VPLTTVRVPFDRIADHAVELLVQQRTGTLGEAFATSPPTLIPRQSTARPGPAR
jgi:LacI family transcriptional regulator